MVHVLFFFFERARGCHCHQFKTLPQGKETGLLKNFGRRMSNKSQEGTTMRPERHNLGDILIESLRLEFLKVSRRSMEL